MPKFTIEHKSAKERDQAYARIKEYLQGENDLRKYDAKMKCEFNDQNKTCVIKGSQYTASVSMETAGSGTLVAVLVDLPLLLTPFKGKVTEMLTKTLSKHLG
jgi:hypothetical protein